jgi:hypothetical protein
MPYRRELTFGVRQEIVMKRTDITANSGRKTMRSAFWVVAVTSDIEWFRNHTALKCDVVC